LHNTQKQGTLSRSGKPSANSKPTSAKGQHNMSSNNSNQQGHRTLQKTSEKDLPSPNQIMEARSKPSEAMENASVADTTAADIDECEDEEFPSQVRNSKQMASEQEYIRSGMHFIVWCNSGANAIFS
jgi:hypothetical protein